MQAKAPIGDFILHFLLPKPRMKTTIKSARREET
jgi:hypothetical protein